MKSTRRHFLAGAIALAPGAVHAGWARSVPEGLIFFVGNSFTRQHDIPGLVCRIAGQTGVRAHCHRHTANGAHLISTIEVPGRLAEDWPGRVPARVVLQDHSVVPLSSALRDESARAMAEWDRHFQGTTLFQTWPRRVGHPLYDQPGMPSGPEEMAELTHAHYRAEARRLGAAVAPVAPAWIEAARRGIDLYAFDGYHANLAGAWLAAMLLAAALGLPDPFEASPPVGVAPGQADKLAEIAAEIF